LEAARGVVEGELREVCVEGGALPDHAAAGEALHDEIRQRRDALVLLRLKSWGGRVEVEDRVEM